MIKKKDIISRYRIIFRSLRYRNYRLFFSGQSLSLVGTWMQRIALPWMVYRITGDSLMLGIVGFAGQIPVFLLSPVAGVLTDRLSRYRVLLSTQVISMILAFFLAWLSYFGHIQIWHIIVISFAFGSLNAFEVPSRHSLLYDMVEKKDDLGNAIALNSMMFNGARLVGPSIAGLILTTFGEGICFAVNAISYLFVIISLFLTTINKKKRVEQESAIVTQFKEGVKYIFGFSPLKHLIILLAIVCLIGMSYSVLMPVFAKQVLLGGSQTYGFLMGGVGSGALLGALYLASRETVLTLGRIIPVAAIMFGAGLVILSFSTIFIFSLLITVITGLGMMLLTASVNTVLQTITDNDKRGRVMSFYMMAIIGTAPFGSLLGGWLDKVVGISVTFLGGGIICVISGVVFLWKLPLLKLKVRPVYVRMGIIPEVAAGIQDASEQ